MFIGLTKRLMDRRKGLENYEIRFKTLTMLNEIYGKEKGYLFIWNTFAYRQNGISRLWMHASESSASLGRSVWRVSWNGWTGRPSNHHSRGLRPAQVPATCGCSEAATTETIVNIEHWEPVG